MNLLTESQISETTDAVSTLIRVTSDELEAQGRGSLAVIDDNGPLDPEAYATVQSMKRAAIRIHAITGESRWLHAANFLQRQIDAGCCTEHHSED
jgi:hypothetical protein